jgi:hypothetical protein
MNTPSSIQALRRANPRAKAGFTDSVAAITTTLHARIAAEADATGTATVTGTDVAANGADLAATVGATPADAAPSGGAILPPSGRSGARRLVRASTVGALVAAAVAMAVVLAVGLPGAGTGVANAAVAVRKAAAVTAAAAERSGTAVVQITHGGEFWAGNTVRWNDGDLAVARIGRSRAGKTGSKLLVVDGTLYGSGPAGEGWVVLGDPESIDPDSGTTPREYLATVREDTGGATVRRITDAMTGLATRRLADGSTVYSGAVAAGQIARESSFKEGRSIRVLPFGFAAHDEAADPAALLDVALTVGTDGIVRDLTVTWGTSASPWSYSVSYDGLGATPAPVAPADARPLRDTLRTG